MTDKQKSKKAKAPTNRGFLFFDLSILKILQVAGRRQASELIYVSDSGERRQPPPPCGLKDEEDYFVI
jgi:hypothetical protein